MRRGRSDPLPLLVAAALVALGVYVATFNPGTVIVPQGSVFTVTQSPWDVNFTVTGAGGRVVGAFTASNQTVLWIHPASSGPMHSGPNFGVCAGRIDSVLPPGDYRLSFYLLGEASVALRITEAVEVLPVTAPPGTSQYAVAAAGTPCAGTT